MNDNTLLAGKIDELEISVKVLNIIELFKNSTNDDKKLLLKSCQFKKEVTNIVNEILRIRNEETFNRIYENNEEKKMEEINTLVDKLTEMITCHKNYTSLIYIINTEFLSLARHMLSEKKINSR